MYNRQIILDTETTGLSPVNGDRIIEIGAIELINLYKTGRNFHTYINPKMAVPLEAYNVHGISTKFLQDKPLFSDIIDDFLTFIGDSELIIHNAPFDMKFINHELKLCRKKPLVNNIIDTLILARKIYPGSSNNLDALSKRFNIDVSHRTKHGALLDSEILYKVYINMLGKRQDEIPVILDDFLLQLECDFSNIYENLIKRNFKCSEEEFGVHLNFVEEHLK